MKTFYQLLVLTIALALCHHPVVVADADADGNAKHEMEYHEPETTLQNVLWSLLQEV